MSSIVASVRDVFESLPTWAKFASVGGTLILVPKIAWTLGKKWKGPRKTPYKTDWKQVADVGCMFCSDINHFSMGFVNLSFREEDGMIYVYQWPRMRSMPSFSPYCIKLETWLRMTELQYENVKIPLTLRSKEGMLPFVEMNGVEYHDSGFIIRDLGKLLGKEKTLDGHLTPEQKAASRALEQMLEMNTWWTYTLIRYVENSDKTLREILDGIQISSFQKFFFQLLSGVIARSEKNAIIKAGIGRHSREDIIQIGLEDMKALSHYLGDKKYLMGDKPTKVDATAFGFLSQPLYFPVATAHAELMKEAEWSNLSRYTERMKDRFWPDWKEICETLELNTHIKRPLP